jgi:predicted RNase H-like HicB family nuclease
MSVPKFVVCLLDRSTPLLGTRQPAAYDFGTMKNTYTAVVQKDGAWWVGWIEEIPGVNSQGASRDELMDNLKSALLEMLELNRESARSAAGDDFEEIRISA